jgi:hypothetical protein
MAAARLFTPSALAALGLLALPAPSSAGSSWITFTGCDLVSNGGEEYGRVTFDLNNVYAATIDYVLAVAVPNQAPDDTCHALAITGPAGWQTFPPGHAIWATDSADAAIAPGETAGPFSMVLSRTTCCFRFYLRHEGDSDPVAVEVACPTCPATTPVTPNTWGGLKAHYR